MSVTTAVAAEPRTVRSSRGFWSDAWARIRRDPTTVVAMSVLFVLVTLAVGADVLADNLFHTGFSTQELTHAYLGPSLDAPRYWLGTDSLGRSEILRLLYGGRVSLFVGAFGSIVAMSIGMTIGMTAGYFGGWWDDVAVWAITTIDSIPLIYLLIMIGLYFRLDAFTLSAFIGGIAWLGAANLARGQTIALRDREYVTAARAIGTSAPGIIVRHIMPNVLPIMIVVLMLAVGGTILAESAISFLGFGIQPPQPSWGNMLSGATQFYFRGPHLIVLPGLAIATTVLCVFLIGDGLRDALDPRLRSAPSDGRRS